MFTRSLLAATCVLALAAPAFADESHHAQQPNAAAAQSADKMPEMMKRMHEQMKQMQAATDPKERQHLMDEHMKTMEEMMQKMMLEHPKEHESAPK